MSWIQISKVAGRSWRYRPNLLDGSAALHSKAAEGSKNLKTTADSTDPKVVSLDTTLPLSFAKCATTQRDGWELHHIAVVPSRRDNLHSNLKDA